MESAPVNPEFVPINPPGEEQQQLMPGPVEPEPQPEPLTQGGRRSRRRRSSRSRRQSRKSRRTRRSRRR